MTNSGTVIAVQDQYLGRRRLNASVVLAMLITVAVTIGFWQLPYRGQISRFFHIGDPRQVPTELIQSGAYVYHGEQGYDGRFFLTLATDPLLTRPSSLTILDDPVYRARRILLPAVVYVLSGGRPIAAEYVFVAVNVVAFVALLWLLDALLARSAMAAWPTAIGLCATGAWVAMLFGTAELVESVLLLAALDAYHRSRFARVGGMLALAMLCRETSALVFVAFAATALIKHQGRLGLHLVWAWIPAAAWNAFVWIRHHASGAVLGQGNFDWPLLGVWHALAGASAKSGVSNEIFWIASLAVLLGVAAIFARNAADIIRADLPIGLAGLAYIALLLCVGRAVLEYHLGYDRAFLPLSIFAGVGLIESEHRTAARWLIAAQACLTFAWLLHLGMKEFRLG